MRTIRQGIWLSFIWCGIIGTSIGLYLHMPAVYFMPMMMFIGLGVAYWEPSHGTRNRIRRLLGIKHKHGRHENEISL